MPYFRAMTRRYALRGDHWERIEDSLPGRPGHVGVKARDNRLFVGAVLYRYRAGFPLRDLPERFGDFRVVHCATRAGADGASGSASSKPWC